ncbi:MAG: hypothetical protein K5739_03495 [Lachnospiraceae bacterium]|nr:hypothetical protein [Lachnospiraceae bacterium]
MSNAAVVKLQQKSIAGNSVWMDDNFGEAIHLHINDFRADLTCKEFLQMTEDACQIIDELVSVPGFRAADYDPVFMEQMLWKHLLCLTEVKRDSVSISDLWMNQPRLVRVKDSHMYRVLAGKKKAYKKKGSDHFGQSSKERMEGIEKSVKASGYDEAKGCVVVYGDDNIIRDGQHRVCALWQQQGNVKVPVVRLYFSDQRPINTKMRSGPFGFFYHCFWKLGEITKRRHFSLKNIAKSMLKGGYFVFKKKRITLPVRMSEKQIAELSGILEK